MARIHRVFVLFRIIGGTKNWFCSESSTDPKPSGVASSTLLLAAIHKQPPRCFADTSASCKKEFSRRTGECFGNASASIKYFVRFVESRKPILSVVMALRAALTSRWPYVKPGTLITFMTRHISGPRLCEFLDQLSTQRRT